MQTPERIHKSPAQPLPENAADCHMHVFGPFDRFPLAPERAYNVNEAPLEAHQRMQRQVGLARTVLVQPSGYGTDNRCLLSALGRLGRCGRAVAVVDLQTPLRELGRLHAAGVRGARLNLYTLGNRSAGDTAQLIDAFARMLAPLKWHLQLLIEAPAIATLEPVLARSPADIVLDHMGLPEAGQGVGQPSFQSLLRLLRSGRIWAKLSGADRVTRHGGRLRDAIPFMRALAAAAPDRLVWGSDWPNTGFHSRQQVAGGDILPHRELDAGELLDLLAEAVPDTDLRCGILTRNPERLYGFD
jgi:predicted TIM-barrel fold metal-dependent hydrolase